MELASSRLHDSPGKIQLFIALEMIERSEQAFSQKLKMGDPGGKSLVKFIKAQVNFPKYFFKTWVSIDAQMPRVF